MPKVLGVALLAAVFAGPATASEQARAVARLEAPVVAAFGANATAWHTTALATSPRRLAAASWWGGTYTVAGGETVSVYVSASYPESDAVARQWADFFAGLPHGAELSALKAYIAPLEEVQELCWSYDVVGCYGGQRLVTVGDSSAGVPPASVAAHEYGHHVAANRINAPWTALAWGTKRWASYARVCSRAQARTAFPGDELMNYELNPGEAFAESYRVLVETNGSALRYDWPIVDGSFRPDATALAAVREDVLHPWVGPTVKTIQGKFLRGSRRWTTTVATPLDGDLRLRLTVPNGGGNDVALLSSNGRTVLATGAWDGSGSKSVEYRVCGTRALKVRVTRAAAGARFTIRLAVP